MVVVDFLKLMSYTLGHELINHSGRILVIKIKSNEQASQDQVTLLLSLTSAVS